MFQTDVFAETHYSVPAAAKLLGISRVTAQRRVWAGEIPAVWLADRWLIPRDAFHKLYPDKAPRSGAAATNGRADYPPG